MFERFEFFGFAIRFAFVDDVHKVMRQHKRHAFAADAKLFLKMAEYVAEVYVEQLRVCGMGKEQLLGLLMDLHCM